MGFFTERQLIENRLSDNWNTTGIRFENVPFVIPTNGDAWISLAIVNGTSYQIDLIGLHRHFSIIIISVFVPDNTGTATIRSHADTIAAIYRNKCFGGIICRSPSIEIVGSAENWYQVNVVIPYQMDKIY